MLNKMFKNQYSNSHNIRFINIEQEISLRKIIVEATEVLLFGNNKQVSLILSSVLLLSQKRLHKCEY